MSGKVAKQKRSQASARLKERRPIRLDATKGAGSVITQLVRAAIAGVTPLALDSDDASIALSVVHAERKLEGAWGVEVRETRVGEIWLVPRSENETAEPAAPQK